MRRLAFLLAVLVAGCVNGLQEKPAALIGAWRSTIQFSTGAFAGIKDLEFMYVFNAGGTLTESSNYDGAPPVPPAYGIWRSVGLNEFEARYEYFVTAPPRDLQSLTGGGGWRPAGRGIFTERITLSADGRTFASTIRYQALDPQGRAVEGPAGAVGQGKRIRLEP